MVVEEPSRSLRAFDDVCRTQLVLERFGTAAQQSVSRHFNDSFARGGMGSRAVSTSRDDPLPAIRWLDVTRG